MGDLLWPFIGAEALSKAVTTERLMRTRYAQLYPGVYLPRGVEPTAIQRAEAAWMWSRRRGVVAGQSAAAVLGAKWVDGTQAAELIYHNRKSPAGLIVRSDELADGGSLSIRGMQVTTAARTAFDLGRHTAQRVQALQRLDALANATGVKALDVEIIASVHPGARGLRRLRAVLPLVDGGAESPQETVARLALTDAGLPAPRTQVKVFGRYGDFIASVDMAYEEVKVAIEYDGPQHWTDPAVRQRDIDKEFAMTEVGWFTVRASRDLLKYRPATYVTRVANALRERGLVW